MSTEADTCRKYVMPTCLANLPRRNRMKAGEFGLSSNGKNILASLLVCAIMSV
jgi:hypothetical protein